MRIFGGQPDVFVEQAQVDIVTGKKTILQFLSKPLIGVKENAFKER